MKKQIKFVSVRVKILCSLVFVSVLLMLAVVTISYRLAMARVERIGMQLSGQYVVSAGEDIKGELKTLSEISDQIMEMQAIHEIAQLPETRSIQDQYEVLGKQLRNDMDSIKSPLNRSGQSFYNVSIFMKNGYVMEMEENAKLVFSDYTGCLEYLSHRRADITEDSYHAPFWTLCGLRGNRQQCLVYVRFVYEPVTLDKIGVVIFSLRNNVLKNVFSGYAPDGFILSNEGVILAAQSSKEIGKTDENTQRIIRAVMNAESKNGSINYSNSANEIKTVMYYQIPSIKGYLIVPFELENAEWEKEMESYVIAILTVSGGVLILGIILSLLFSRGLTTSVASLMRFMEDVERGDENLRYQKKSNDEIGLLGDKINHMLDELTRLNLSREQEMKANQLAELRLMQQQINPHLLYNTLDSVLWGMQRHNYQDATETLIALSEFFKLSLSRGQMEITLSEEIRMVESYMDIQNKARCKNFVVNCQIPKELQSHPIMKLSIQPLVENSVQHGFSGYRDDGEVQIKAWREADFVIVTVEDNGIGMETEEVKKMQVVLNLPSCPKEYRHFGLYNIHRRLVQNYGDAYGLSIESEVSEYTRITVYLPYRKSTSQENAVITENHEEKE